MGAQWFRYEFSRFSRHRLYLNGNETPYFVDGAKDSLHRQFGKKYSLWGSGMHPAGCAKLLGYDSKIKPIKEYAEALAKKTD